MQKPRSNDLGEYQKVLVSAEGAKCNGDLENYFAPSAFGKHRLSLPVPPAPAITFRAWALIHVAFAR